ncbi:MAG: type II toxin-antitoxin system VapC family toxin [Candidatus Scalindua sp.]
MANNMFLDTSGLFAFLVKNDEKHKKASTIIRKSVKNGMHLITTDYIIDETATLLKARGFTQIIPNLFDGIMSSKACRIEWIDQDLFNMTKAMFLRYNDKKWAFTDCFSFIIMKKLGIMDALTKDSHFLEAGFTPLLK